MQLARCSSSVIRKNYGCGSAPISRLYTQPPVDTNPPPLKPFSAIPGPSWGTMFWTTLKIDFTKPFEWYFKLQRQYGDLVRFDYFGQKLVYCYDPNEWEHIHHAVGKYPAPLLMPPWIERDRRLKAADPNYVPYIHISTGKEWKDRRVLVDQKLLVVSQVQNYMEGIDTIASDFVKIIGNSLDSDGKSNKLEETVFSYSTEGIGWVVFGTRIHALAEHIPERARKFQETLHSLFDLLMSLTFSRWYYWWNPRWKKFNQAIDDIEKLGAEFSKEAAAAKGEHKQDLTSFMMQNGVSSEVALKDAITMFFAGSHSTSLSILWLIYNLGKYPEIQEKVRAEVASIITKDEKITPESLKKMRYVRDTIKENLRFSFPTSGLFRVLDEPTSIGGYEIPPKTIITLMQWVQVKNKEYFKDPYKFRPERWAETKHFPWIHLPFGFGPRMCQGFRVSELEQYIVLIKLIQNFRWTTEGTVEPLVKLFIEPDKPLQIKWTKI